MLPSQNRNPFEQVKRDIERRIDRATNSPLKTNGNIQGANSGLIVDNLWVPAWTLGVSELGVDTYL